MLLSVWTLTSWPLFGNILALTALLSSGCRNDTCYGDLSRSRVRCTLTTLHIIFAITYSQPYTRWPNMCHTHSTSTLSNRRHLSLGSEFYSIMIITLLKQCYRCVTQWLGTESKSRSKDWLFHFFCILFVPCVKLALNVAVLENGSVYGIHFMHLFMHHFLCISVTYGGKHYVKEE